jgi:DNA polymerase I-like protein with 3'-5' exonuclease and polymerase domains
MSGLFWQGGPPAVTRMMPPIPETNWRTPRDFPNLAAANALSIDCETWDPELTEHGPGWARGRGHIVGIAVGTDDGHRWYFPMRHTVEPEFNLPPEHVLAWAGVELARPTQPKLGANLIYDVGWLRQEGVRVAGELFDVEFAEALLDESATVNLGDLGQRYCGQGKTSAQLYDWCRAWYGGGEDQRANIWRAPPRLMGPYAEGDVDLPFRVLDKQWQRLQAEGLLDLFRMECALIPLLVEMRFAGVSVDLAHAEQVRADLLAASIEEQAKLRSIVGFEINVNAAASIAKAFDKFGYQYERTAKGAPSFDKDFLSACKNPVADAINEIRKLDKLRTTFVENYILGAHVNGKVYCSFNPLRADETGARSGRFSSNDPNLQNIPVRDKKWGKKLRSLFVPDSGHKQWRKFDYSQIEYRFLVHFAVGPGADEARRKYQDDPSTDYHAWVQNELVGPRAGWDMSTPELKKLWRFLTKNLNFGAVYGIGEGHMAELLQKPRSEAKRILDDYHKALPFVRATMQAVISQIDQQGYITTILGRRRRFNLWEAVQRFKTDKERKANPPLPYEVALLKYGNIKRAGAYKGLNGELQGSAADLFKTAMLKCWTSGVYGYTGVPRLIVHDEKDFSDAGGADEAFAEMKRIMETALTLRVPVMAEEERGANWGQLATV